MFSQRIHWDTTPNPLTRLLRQKRLENVSILDLTESNPTRVGFHYPETKILSAFQERNLLRYEPTPKGIFEARHEVCLYYFDKGIELVHSNLHLTASTSEAYSYLFKLLTDPGDEVLIPRPGYPLAEYLAALEHVTLRQYDLRFDAESGWRIDFTSLEAAVNERTRALVVINPNNPTGSYLSQKEIDAITQFCADHKIVVISDEVFFDFKLDEEVSPHSFLQAKEMSLIFVVNGFSKILVLPQMKLGWIATRGPEKLVDEARERLDIITDTYLSVGTPIQQAAKKLFEIKDEMQNQIRDRSRKNLATLERIARNSDVIHALRVEGGWYGVIEVTVLIIDETTDRGKEEQFVYELLEKENVLVHPGYFYDFPVGNFIVVSLLVKEEVFEEGIKRMMEMLGKN